MFSDFTIFSYFIILWKFFIQLFYYIMEIYYFSYFIILWKFIISVILLYYGNLLFQLFY